MLYECATGRQPFSGAGAYEILHAIVTATPPDPRALNPALPRDFVAIIERAMHRDPAKRYADVRALGSALLAFAGRRVWAIWGAELTGAPGSSAAADATARELEAAPRVSVSPRRSRARLGASALAIGGVLCGAALGRASGWWMPASGAAPRVDESVVTADKTPNAEPRALARTSPGAPADNAVLVHRAKAATPSSSTASTPEPPATLPVSEPTTFAERNAKVAKRPRSSAPPARRAKADSKPRPQTGIEYELGANGVPIID
jgi:hypothetical protein